eukprot:m.27226 g.27226  ORF g.27226 m.27226 type:complete len:76 (+) comp11754_c0_seq30:1547-1774(+)
MKFKKLMAELRGERSSLDTNGLLRKNNGTRRAVAYKDALFVHDGNALFDFAILSDTCEKRLLVVHAELSTYHNGN